MMLNGWVYIYIDVCMDVWLYVYVLTDREKDSRKVID